MARKGAKLDFNALQAVLTLHKKLELADDSTNEGDEYLDAFVALGGQPNKDGYIEKDMLIQIIKIEFTWICSNFSFRKINFFDYCIFFNSRISNGLF